MTVVDGADREPVERRDEKSNEEWYFERVGREGMGGQGGARGQGHDSVLSTQYSEPVENVFSTNSPGSIISLTPSQNPRPPSQESR